ncbi:MAG: MerR family transcriptional regulator [Firmicutes bacterium]|nr:MerR family transcriptional regulator [Bacillota bacterium]
MEYTINKLAKISGVTARTLRYYDEIGLLKPLRVASTGYRIYGQHEVTTLQQILLYREQGFTLDEIKRLLFYSNMNLELAFVQHLQALRTERKRLDKIIETVQKSLNNMRGETIMQDTEKFEGLKKSLIEENEQKYGAEIRQKYGDAAIDQSNAKINGLTQAEYTESERLRCEYEELLVAALKTGNPASELAQKACDLHRQWLSIYYPAYSKQYHAGLAEMYVADERFKEHYEKLGSGCAEFLAAAIKIYVEAT